MADLNLYLEPSSLSETKISYDIVQSGPPVSLLTVTTQYGDGHTSSSDVDMSCMLNVDVSGELYCDDTAYTPSRTPNVRCFDESGNLLGQVQGVVSDGNVLTIPLLPDTATISVEVINGSLRCSAALVPQAGYMVCNEWVRGLV